MRFTVVLAIAMACRNPLPLDGRPCPCVAGYTCDAIHDVCMPGDGPPDGGAPDGGPHDGSDTCLAPICQCSIATEATDCGPHQFCDSAEAARRCACVAGYTDSGQGCVWTGTVRDPAISEPTTWTMVNGALLDPAAPGGVDPGEAIFIAPMLCTLAHIKQTFDMPRFASAERLVLQLSYQSSHTGHVLLGVSWGHGWMPLPHFADDRFHTARICLGESAYAPPGTTGRGAPVTLSLGGYEDAGDCPSTSATELAVDHVQIVTADPGECGARFGEGVNSDAESTGGWTFSLFAGGSGGFEPGIGVGGSHAARVQASVCDVTASMRHPIDIVASNPALELFVGTTGGATSTIARAHLAAGLFPIPLPAIGQTAALHMCLPPSLAGQSTDLVFSVETSSLGNGCPQSPESSILADDVHVIEDPTCQANDAAGNPGFERPDAVLAASDGGRLGDGAVGSAILIRNTAGVAHSGTGYLAIESYGRCSMASVELAPIVPAPRAGAGPALTLFSELSNARDIVTTLHAGATAISLATGDGWIKNTLCLNPRFAGRPQRVFLDQYGGRGADQDCDTAGYGTQAALIDDLEVTTDPSCPTQ